MPTDAFAEWWGEMGQEEDTALAKFVWDAATAVERERAARVAKSDEGRDSYLGGYSVQDIQRVASKRIAKAIRTED